MIFLYQILSAAAALILAPCFAGWSLATGAKRRGLLHHFGLVPPHGNASSQKTLWVHALSLGEVVGAAPVLQQVHDQRPDLRVVVSVTTDSGYDAAQQHLAFAEQIFFHPFDCFPFTLLALNRIRPDLFVVMDTGFWPGLLDLLDRQGVPSFLLNGRMSQKSFRRYRILRPFLSDVLNRFAALCVQSEDGRKMLLALGVEPFRIQVTGNPKYDALQPLPAGVRTGIREKMGIREGRPVWVAGSTHEGEEEILLDTHNNLKARLKDPLLILAPRRLERVGEVARLLEQKQLSFIKRSELNESGNPARDVVLLDTMGELAQVYSIGDAAFVGRSLVSPGGGHSLIEPVAQGIPVLHGPFIENNRHTANELRPHGLSIEVRDVRELEETLFSLFQDAGRRAELAAKAETLIKENQGAARTLADLILKSLPE